MTFKGDLAESDLGIRRPDHRRSVLFHYAQVKYTENTLEFEEGCAIVTPSFLLKANFKFN